MTHFLWLVFFCLSVLSSPSHLASASPLVANEMVKKVNASLKNNPVGSLYVNSKPLFRFESKHSSTATTLEITGLVSIKHTHSSSESKSVVKLSGTRSAGFSFGLSQKLLSTKWFFDALNTGSIDSHNSRYKITRKLDAFTDEFVMTFEEGNLETARFLFSPQKDSPELLSAEFIDRDKERFLFLVD